MPTGSSGPRLTLDERTAETALLGSSLRVHLRVAGGEPLSGVFMRPESDEGGYWDVPVAELGAPESGNDESDADDADDESDEEREPRAVGVSPDGALAAGARKQNYSDEVVVEVSLPNALADVMNVCFVLRGYDAAGVVGESLRVCFNGVRVRGADRPRMESACDSAIECDVWEPYERDECIAVIAAGLNVLRNTAPSCGGNINAYRDCITAPASCEEIDELDRAFRNDSSTLPRCQDEVDAVFECSFGDLLNGAFDDL